MGSMPSCVEIIEIDDDDDDSCSNDDGHDEIEEAIKRSLCDQWISVCKNTSAKRSTDMKEVIEIHSDDDNDNDDNDEDDDDIEVVDATSIIIEKEKEDLRKQLVLSCQQSSVKQEEEEEDVMVVGKVKSLQLPHMRQHCTEYPFICDVRHLVEQKSKSKSKVKEGLECNSKYCQLCYCYVCDIPASDCTKWFTTKKKKKGKEKKGKGKRYSNNKNDHCLASDTGIEQSHWNKLRLIQRTKKSKIHEK